MERRQVEHFLAIVDHGGFTAAAAAIYVSQPSLSHSIKSLERDLDAQLFHRTPRGARLTPAGEVFTESARRIVREMETARTRVQEIGGLLAGRLDVISQPGMLLEPFARHIGWFRTRYPRVMVRMRHAQSAVDAQQAVRSGAVELALCGALAGVDKELVSEQVAEHDFVAILPPGVPAPSVLTMDRLLDLDIIAGPVGTVVRDMLSAGAARQAREFAPVVEVEDRSAGLYLAVAGAGVAVLPRPFAVYAEALGAAIVDLDPPYRLGVHLVHRMTPLSPAAVAMRALLIDAGSTPPGGTP